jgi:hypothetical protein
MAVTKIRKLSSWTLLVVMAISVAVLALFYLGGVVDPNSEQKEPIQTSLLLYWCYAIFAITIAGVLLFGVFQFVSSLKANPKAAIASVIVLIAFAALLGVTYTLGGETPLNNINEDSARFNVPVWLKVSDMWLFTSYALLVLSILAMIGGSIKKVLNK